MGVLAIVLIAAFLVGIPIAFALGLASLAFLLTLLAAAPSRAENWPQWLGPSSPP